MSQRSTPVKVLMVCLGNICRSPTAHAVFRAKVEEAGLSDKVVVDSAGTGNYHIGEKPDKRARSAAKQRGYDLSGLRARQVQPRDFDTFDYVLAMDDNNFRDLLAICPLSQRHKIHLFMEYADENTLSVPDPYYSGDDGFQLVLNLAEEASVALLEHIRQTDLQ